MTDLQAQLAEIEENVQIAQDGFMAALEAKDRKIQWLAGEVTRLEAENELLRKRIVQLIEPSDDLADAAEDRKRDIEFAKSEAYQDRNARG